MLSENRRVRHSSASRLLYFGIDLFWSVPPWPNQQQEGPHAPPYSVPPVNAIALNRAQSRWSYMRSRLWGAHEREPRGFPTFGLLRGQLGNRSPADPKHSGCGAVRRNHHSKTPEKGRSGTPLVWCAPPQRGEFLQLLSGATTGSQEVPQPPASRRKAE